MSHLGDRLSALVDGELGHDERDRLLVHLAACKECRTEAAALRALKRRVGALEDPAIDATLLARLLMFAEPGEPVPDRRRALRGALRPALLMYPDAQPSGRRPRGTRRSVNWRADGGQAEGGRAPLRPGWSAGRPSRRRANYVIASVVSFVVVGVGGLSFVVGGGEGAPGPHITPPVEMFTVEHSVTTGEVPFANPAATFLPTPAAPRGGP